MSVIPGIDDATVAVGAPQPAFRTHAISSGSTITIPAAADAGDLAVLFDHADTNFGIPSYVLPSGWTEIHTDQDLDIRIITSYRVLAASDAGSVVTGMNGNTTDAKLMLVFSGIHGGAVTINDKAIQLTQGTPANQTVNASGYAGHLIVVGACGLEGGSAAFNTETPAFTQKLETSGAHIVAGYAIYAGAGVDHTIGKADQGGGNRLESFLVAIA